MLPGGHASAVFSWLRGYGNLMRTSLRILAATAFVIAGCQTQGQRHASGAEIVSAYLHAAAGGEPQLGWSLLSAGVKDSFDGDVDRYLAVVGQADFAGLKWEVEEVESEDDFLFVRVRAVQGTFPTYLSETRANRAIAWGSGERREFSVTFGLFGGPELGSYGG